MKPCSVPACPKAAKVHGLCWGHLKQLQRGQDIRPLFANDESPRDRLERYSVELGNADTDNDAEYARVRRLWLRAFRDCLVIATSVGLGRVVQTRRTFSPAKEPTRTSQPQPKPTTPSRSPSAPQARTTKASSSAPGSRATG